jgi:hypothetical protein
MPSGWLLALFIAMFVLTYGLALVLHGTAVGSMPLIDQSESRNMFFALTAAVMLADCSLSLSGAISNFDTLPPPFAWFLFSLLAINISFCLRTDLGRRLANLPLWLLVGAQAFRFLPELWLHLGWLEGSLPVQMTWPPHGRNVDAGVASLALALGAYLARHEAGGHGRPGTRAAAVWAFALLGSASLANIVGTAMLSLARPLRDEHAPDYFEPGLEVLATAPYVLLPGFILQLAVALHALLFRRLLGGAEGEAGPGYGELREP